jgi:hypothetical protein
VQQLNGQQGEPKRLDHKALPNQHAGASCSKIDVPGCGATRENNSFASR